MDVDDVSLEELFRRLNVDDGESELATLFVELVGTICPQRIADAQRVIQVLRSIQASDNRLRHAIFEYNACIEFQKDFPDKSCEQSRMDLEKARKQHQNDRKRLTKELNNALEHDP